MVESKDLFTGVALQVGAKSISHLGFIYLTRVLGIPDAEVRTNPWYAEPVIGLPPVDDWVCCLGIPAVFYLLGREREKFKDMAIGAGVAGIATLINNVIAGIPKLIAPPTAAQVFTRAASKYLVT